jgi:hypothetical protein
MVAIVYYYVTFTYICNENLVTLNIQPQNSLQFMIFFHHILDVVSAWCNNIIGSNNSIATSMLQLIFRCIKHNNCNESYHCVSIATEYITTTDNQFTLNHIVVYLLLRNILQPPTTNSLCCKIDYNATI